MTFNVFCVRPYIAKNFLSYSSTTKNLWINKSTRFVIQGMTGHQGTLHAKLCMAYRNTNIVGGINPKKRGSYHLSLPIYGSCREAKEEASANASLLFVPASFAKSAIFEAIDAEFDLIIAITEGIPQWDMIEVKNRLLSQSKTRLVGPNCPGIIAPGQVLAGIMPSEIHKKGQVGIVSRSGTLTYEAVSQLTHENIGQKLVIGIGGDSILGTNFIDVVKEFIENEEIKSIVIIGEIGGNAEEDLADYLASISRDDSASTIKWNKAEKPIVAYIAGQTAPQGKRMGHAGAIISGGGKGDARSKIEALTRVGVEVVDLPTKIGSKMKHLMKL